MILWCSAAIMIRAHERCPFGSEALLSAGRAMKADRDRWRGRSTVAAFVFSVTVALSASSDRECHAGLIHLTPAVDGFAHDRALSGSFNSPVVTSANIPIQLLSGGEVRGMFEFDIRPVPLLASVESVSFQFRTVSFTTNTTEVEIFGYAGDGLLTVEDATRPGTLLTTYDPNAVGIQTVDLGPAFLQSLLGTSDSLGLRLQGALPPVNMNIAGFESGAASSPQLIVEFSIAPTAAVPEASSLSLLSIGMFVLFGWRLRRVRPIPVLIAQAE